jgi:NitT/TauT family transport system substrate-binding protein
MDKIKVGLPHRGAGLAPLFAAMSGGYFHDEGITIELVPFNGHARSLESLIAGAIDFTNAVGPELIMANERTGGDAVVIASAIGRSAQQISARPGLTAREQLRHKRWAIQARHDADECSIAMTLERWGWDYRKDVELVIVGHDGARLDLLLDEDRADVAIMHAPEPFQAIKRGWLLVFDLGQLDVSFQNSCAATTKRLLTTRPDLALRYTRAFCNGVYRFRTDAAFGLSVLKEQTGETDEFILRKTWTLFARLMGGYMFPSVEGLRNAASVLRKVGALTRVVEPEEVSDLSFVATLEQEDFFAQQMCGAAS